MFVGKSKPASKNEVDSAELDLAKTVGSPAFFAPEVCTASDLDSRASGLDSESAQRSSVLDNVLDSISSPLICLSPTAESLSPLDDLENSKPSLRIIQESSKLEDVKSRSPVNSNVRAAWGEIKDSITIDSPKLEPLYEPPIGAPIG